MLQIKENYLIEIDSYIIHPIYGRKHRPKLSMLDTIIINYRK